MGSSIITGGLSVLSVIILAVSAGFLLNAAVRITGIKEKDYTTDPDLKLAHRYASWGGGVGIITAILIVIGTILLFYFGGALLGGGKFFVYGILFLSLAGVIATGILAALTAYYINKADVKDNNLSYQQSIIAAVLAIVGFFFILTITLVRIFEKPKVKKDPLDDEIKILEEKQRKIESLPDNETLTEPITTTKTEKIPVVAATTTTEVKPVSSTTRVTRLAQV